TVIAACCPVRRVYLPAPPAATAAPGAFFIERYVTEFARHSVRTVQEVSIAEDAHANTFGHRNHHQVLRSFRLSEPHFREYAGIRGVLHIYLQARGPFQRCY